MSDDNDNELSSLISDVMAEHCGAEVVESSEGGWSADLWAVLDELGMTAVGVPEEDGGSGGDLRDVATILRTTARFAAPLPLGHTLLVAPFVRRTMGLVHRNGPSAVAIESIIRAEPAADGWRLTGSITEVPYGRVVDNVILLAAGRDGLVAAEIAAADLEWTHAENLAGEPRDAAEVDLVVPSVAAAEEEVRSDIRDAEALAQAWALVGAMERVRTLTVNYTTEREQFGRALARFQAVKQLAAVIAGEISVSAAAAGAATSAMAAGEPAAFPIAAARLRAAMAVTPVSQAAHQLHGAIGYTREYPLHQFTRRLWSWRDEGLSERQWMTLAGERALANGADQVWHTIAV